MEWLNVGKLLRLLVSLSSLSEVGDDKNSYSLDPTAKTPRGTRLLCDRLLQR